MMTIRRIENIIHYTFDFIGSILHELCHLIMIVILRPFGVKLSGVKIKIFLDQKGDYQIDATVSNISNNSKICVFLIACAPIIFYVMAVCFLFKYHHWFLLWWFYMSWRSFILSKKDFENVKGCFNKKYLTTMNSDELKKHLNN